MRPPLTKALWTGKAEDSIWRGTAELGVDVHARAHDRRRSISTAATATDDQGETYSLRAAAPRDRRQPAPASVRLPRASSTSGRYDDYRRLRELAGDGVRVAVIGGGFIGSEIAARSDDERLSRHDRLPGAGIGSRLFPAELSAFVNEYYREKGVDVLAEELVDSIASHDDGFRVETQSGRVVEADAVVAGLGIVPTTELAEAAGLEVDDGILVDEHGRAGGRDDVFAAGDVARFPVPALGGTRRVEHEDHANTHGRLVGANMAGADAPYDHLPFFYSDLFELGYEAVGDVDSRLETIAEWEEPNRKGVVGYVDGRQAARVPALGRLGQGRFRA